MEPNISNDKIINITKEILSLHTNNKLRTALNSCVHCNLCNTSCHFYLANNSLKFSPSKKVDAVASLYRRYCTVVGKICPPFTGGKKITDSATIEEMVDLLYGGCTLCGRCVPHCSIGVDIPFVVRTGRKLIAELGYMPKSLSKEVENTIISGNNMAVKEEDFIDTLKWMEEELQDELNTTASLIPVNKKDAKYFYTLNPREVKFFPLSIASAAKIFYAANIDWTVSSKFYDITNYGYFSGSEKDTKIITENLFTEIEKFNSKTALLGECGHGSRVFRWETPNILKKTPPFEIITMLEFVANLIKTGQISVDKTKFSKIYTIHDPCNFSRNGGLADTLRFVVSSVVPNLVELRINGVDSFCCGGGGGFLAMGEYKDRRIAAGKIKADLIKESGANVVITTCHNCIDQISQLNQAYELGIEVKSIAEIVADALIL